MAKRAALDPSARRQTLETLLGPELSPKSIAKMSSARLEELLLRMERGWRQWIAAEYRDRPPPEGIADKETLERALPVLRGIVEAKKLQEGAESVVVGQMRTLTRNQRHKVRKRHTAYAFSPLTIPTFHLDLDLPYPPSPKQVESARQLVELRYRELGYLSSDQKYEWSEGAIPLIAVRDNQVVATLSLIVDEGSLPAETVFPEEVSALRAKGRRIVEVGAFAANADASSKVQTHATLTLVDLAMEVCRGSDTLDQALLAVHPHHAGFYEKRLGARRVVADPRPHPKVKDAPAVLLAVEAKDVRRTVHQEIEFVAAMVLATIE